MFETRDSWGGIWNYTEQSEGNIESLESNAYYKLYGWLGPSLYDNLKTNIPSFWMLFKDFPKEENIDKIVTSYEYFKYICDYAEHFGLKKYIQYNRFMKW